MPSNNVSERKKELRALINKINKEYDRPLISYANEVPNPYFMRYPTGCMQLDIDLGGGFPAGGMSTITGPDGCLDGNTLIHHEVRDENGERLTHKWITMKRLYERFHKIPGRPGKLAPSGVTFHVPSMNDSYGIVMNQVVDVVCTGEKECFEIITKKGFRLEATAEHFFFDGETYVTLADLRVGSAVYIHNNTTKKRAFGMKKPRRNRAFLYLKWHPTASIKKIYDKKTGNTYEYRILPKARAVVEAAMNNMTLEEYISALNEQKPLRTLPQEAEVHHKDEDWRNDSLPNLIVLTKADHARGHLQDEDRSNYFRFMAIQDKVASIQSVGKRTTYDLKMAAPYNNYVANNFVVHNSGKTALLYRTMGFHQRIYGDKSTLAFAALEFLPDYLFMRDCGVRIALPDEMIDKMRQIRRDRGVPDLTKAEIVELKSQTGEFVIIRGATGQDVLDGVLECFASKQFGIIGIDGVNSFMTNAEAEAESIGDSVQQSGQASLLTRFCHKFHPMTLGLDGLNLTAMICTGQVRANRDRANAPSYMQKMIKQWIEIFPWTVKHARLLGVSIWKGEKIRETKGADKGDQIGSILNWETIKGKAGTHDGIRGEAEFTYENIFSDPQTVIAAGIRYGVLRETKGILCVIRKEDGEILEDGIPGTAGFLKRVNEDLDFDLAVRGEILAAAGKTCSYR